MSANVQPAWSTSDRHWGLPIDARPRLSVADPGIDDPVNHTGLGRLRRDLQLSDDRMATKRSLRRKRSDLAENLACMRTEGMGESRLLSLANRDQQRESATATATAD